jgi:predicted transcriptional regulator
MADNEAPPATNHTDLYGDPQRILITQQSLAAILTLVARFKAVRESQGLTLAEVAERMGIDAPALSRLETGRMLNPTLATLHKWAEALGHQLDVQLSAT